MLELVKGCHKRTVLTKTVLVISISVCTNSTVSIGTLQGLQEINLSRILYYSVSIKWIPLYWSPHLSMDSLQILP